MVLILLVIGQECHVASFLDMSTVVQQLFTKIAFPSFCVFLSFATDKQNVKRTQSRHFQAIRSKINT